MKKKILFVLPSFGIGGTTVSTRNLIAVLGNQHYEATVWALNDLGILQGMYDGVGKVKTCFAAQAMTMSGWKDENGWIKRLAVAFLRFLRNHSHKAERFLIRHSIKKCLGNRQFDTVVACQEGFATLFASYIDAPNKLAWVRCDYKEYIKTHHNRKEGFYSKFNGIVCVAEQTTRNFKEIYPEFADKTFCIYNPQDSGLIRKQALDNDHDPRFVTDKPVVLSVGRLSKVKRFVEIPRIARELMAQGIDFRWFVIGDGEEKSAIQKAIDDNKVSDIVILLGAKSNPHFYISKAYLYVCLSSTEACPRVINEAKILGTPVVSTDFDTVYEYISSDVNGLICPIGKITDEIERMLTDKNLYCRIKENIKSFEFDNREIIEKLETIF